MRQSERLWWGFLAFWLLLVALNLYSRGGGFWLRLASTVGFAALSVVNLVRLRRERLARDS